MKPIIHFHRWRGVEGEVKFGDQLVMSPHKVNRVIKETQWGKLVEDGYLDRCVICGKLAVHLKRRKWVLK